MSITYELFFQIFNTLILMLIPELEKRVRDLENK